jgi:hypothetical protein
MGQVCGAGAQTVPMEIPRIELFRGLVILPVAGTATTERRDDSVGQRQTIPRTADAAVAFELCHYHGGHHVSFISLPRITPGLHYSIDTIFARVVL